MTKKPRQAKPGLRPHGRPVHDELGALKRAHAALKTAEDTAGQIIQMYQKAQGEAEGAKAAHAQALGFVVRACAEGAAAMVALKVASGSLREDTDPALLAAIEAALKGQNGAAFVQMLHEAQRAAIGAQPYVELLHEAAAALREAEHELMTCHGLKAIDDAKGPSEGFVLDFDKAVAHIGAVVAKYDALVSPPKEAEAEESEPGATVTRLPGVEHAAECAEGMDAGHGCACHGHEGPGLPKLEPGADDPSKWVTGGSAAKGAEAT